MSLRILVVDTYYPEFLAELYAADPTLSSAPYEKQRERIFSTLFGVSDAYPHFLNKIGCTAEQVICNADHLQRRWAAEHGLALSDNVHDMRREIVAAQITEFNPDVLYVFEWSPLGDTFLKEMQSNVKLVAGQMASPLPPNRSYSGYQLMISSWPPIVEYFRKGGKVAEILRLGFDPRVLEKLAPCKTCFDVTFVGGFAPSHPDRVSWLEKVMREVKVDVFGYGLERVPAESPIHSNHHGAVWGRKMYDVMQQSRITLNRHALIDVRGTVSTHLATNMRLYEATGVGTCLLTESKENLPQLFEPNMEVLTYADDDECIEQIKNYLYNADQRLHVAKAGQMRTLREHSYDFRMNELVEILRKHL